MTEESISARGPFDEPKSRTKKLPPTTTVEGSFTFSGRGRACPLRSGPDARVPEEHPALVEHIAGAVEGQYKVTTYNIPGSPVDRAYRLRTVGAQQLANHRRVALCRALSSSVDHALIAESSCRRVTRQIDISSGHRQDSLIVLSLQIWRALDPDRPRGKDGKVQRGRRGTTGARYPDIPLYTVCAGHGRAGGVPGQRTEVVSPPGRDCHRNTG